MATRTSASGGNDPNYPTLSTWQLAGEHLLATYGGLTPPSGLLTKLCQGQFAGVFFTGDNISSNTQIAGVVAQLKRASECSTNPLRNYPLILQTDQEGGEVRRLSGAPLLSEKQIGESSNPPAAATAAGTGAAQTLLSVGMTANAAPIPDCYRQPGDFYDQYQRAYSMNYTTAGNLAADFIKAQQAKGVAATAKHFPSLCSAGATQNTDVGPVTLWDHLSRIRTVDEDPYRTAIAAGVRLIMMSWAVYPNIGSRRPAGLSSLMVKGELRTRLGFNGVIETDAIEAGALNAFGSLPSRAVQAEVAGDDLVLDASENYADSTGILQGLVTAYKTGVINNADFTASADRVLDLRSTLP